MKWNKLYLNQIELHGIHKDLLQKQGNGLSKHIGEVFDDLSDNSAWLGGKGEAWERGPYYLDGLIPLAYLLRDQDLINKSTRWVDSILSSQQDSGFFGPTKNNDWWPRAVVLKAMVSAYLASKDDRIIQFVRKYIDYLLDHIEDHPLNFWGYSRGMEGMEMFDFISKNLPLDTYNKIEHVLRNNTINWKHYFNEFPFPKLTEYYMSKHLFHIVKYFTSVMDSFKRKKTKPAKIKKEKIMKSRNKKNNLVFLETHGVNIAMALKYLIYWNETPEKMFEGLDKILFYHGNATGIFSSDEHLNGTNPEAGIELCNVVEMMYSMEETIRLTGNMEACDRLEQYAYNALLTTISHDFTSHQYVQQVNQFDCEIKRHPFYDSNRYANTFGVEPNYGCCAANMHQGWPKMFLSAVMSNQTHLGIFLYINGVYTVEFDDGYIKLEIMTQYPFGDTVTIKCIESTVRENPAWILRIPYKARTEITMKDESFTVIENDCYAINSVQKGDTINLKFHFEIKTIHNPDNTVSVQRGPLLYSRQIDHKEFYIKGKKPFNDRGYSPLERPKIELLTHHKKVIVKEMMTKSVSNSFFENMNMIKTVGYDLDNNSTIDVILVPYGLTTLRLTHFKYKEE